MNVANKDLCDELYELSGWEATQNNYYQLADKSYRIATEAERGYQWDYLCPAYSLGYLLRKLKEQGIFATAGYSNKRNMVTSGADTAIAVAAGAWGSNRVVQDSPEDALCRLAIELFKQKILKREAA